jgi:hypothetical protein
MFISGVIILRNAVLNDYPAVEAIKSVLPLVDEMIVSLDKGDDNTEELIRQISDPKIKMIPTQWDMTKREGGKVYADETNKAMAAIYPKSDWIFYIQADEVIHEADYELIREAARTYKDDSRIQGLLFEYLHFYGTYDYVGVGRQWYNHEVRMIKNSPAIQSYKDAQGFRLGGRKLKVVRTKAKVFHYGWVKSPRGMKQKMDTTIVFYSGDDEGIKKLKEEVLTFDFNNFGKLTLFNGSHPSVMGQRILQKNWQLNFDTRKNIYSLKDRFLNFIEWLTGKRLFEFQNYTVVKNYRFDSKN